MLQVVLAKTRNLEDDTVILVIARLCELNPMSCRSGPLLSVFARSPRRLPGVFREAIQDSLIKSIEIVSIFFIETRCRISWTATSTHKNEFPRGIAKGMTQDFLGRKSFAEIPIIMTRRVVPLRPIEKSLNHSHTTQLSFS